MDKLVSNLEDSNVHVRIYTTITLLRNMMVKANDALEAMGNRSVWVDLREEPGQSALRAQSGERYVMLIIAAAGAKASMAYINHQKVIRHLMPLMKTGTSKESFASKVSTELADQNYLPISTNTQKTKNYITDAARALRRIMYVAAFLGEVLVAVGGHEKRGRKSKGESSRNSPFLLSPFRRGVYEYEN